MKKFFVESTASQKFWAAVAVIASLCLFYCMYFITTVETGKELTIGEDLIGCIGILGWICIPIGTISLFIYYLTEGGLERFNNWLNKMDKND